MIVASARAFERAEHAWWFNERLLSRCRNRVHGLEHVRDFGRSYGDVAVSTLALAANQARLLELAQVCAGRLRRDVCDDRELTCAECATGHELCEHARTRGVADQRAELCDSIVLVAHAVKL